MQTLHFIYAVGGILSPIATSPFLLSTPSNKNNETQWQSTTKSYDEMFSNAGMSGILTTNSNGLNFTNTTINDSTAYNDNKSEIGGQGVNSLPSLPDINRFVSNCSDSLFMFMLAKQIRISYGYQEPGRNGI